MEKLIITVALTGNVPTKDINPNLPVTADEIAVDVRRCADAGAVLFHVHSRDANQQPTLAIDAFKETGVKPEIEVFEAGMINNLFLPDGSAASNPGRSRRP